MAMRNSVSIRFPDDVRSQLEEVARRAGLTAADLVRLATNQYLRDVQEKGVINIDLNGRKKSKG